ncbi:MAG: ROK family glucokinase [Candidatus Eremiobacteraeota bacterium]|nr:ROK family glucokinase [Candidatus Eremiobacteraeota bacterium]
MRHVIGIDLGGSHVSAGVVAEGGEIVDQHQQDITDHDFEAVLAVVEAVVRPVIKSAKDVACIGLGSPGNIDRKTGEVLYSPNFGWHNVPLGARLQKIFDRPVFVGNDARCATLGEYTFGTGRGTKDFVLLTLGTGIGGGIVSGGALLRGNKMGAGEIGHHQIRPADGFVCGCGKTGCFEAQASGTALIRHASAVASSFPRSTLLRKDPEKLGSKAIRKAAQAGDQHALVAWKNYCADLAIGLANIIAFVNPEVIALGGGVSSAGKFMLESVEARTDELTTMVPKGTTKIVIAKLGNDAGLVGAATMALRGGLKT